MRDDDECLGHGHGGMHSSERGAETCRAEMLDLSILAGSYGDGGCGRKFFFQWAGTSVGSDADYPNARAARQAGEAFERVLLAKHMPTIRAALLRELVGLQSLLTGQDSFDGDAIAVLRILAEDSGFLSRGIPTP